MTGRLQRRGRHIVSLVPKTCSEVACFAALPSARSGEEPGKSLGFTSSPLGNYQKAGATKAIRVSACSWRLRAAGTFSGKSRDFLVFSNDGGWLVASSS